MRPFFLSVFLFVSAVSLHAREDDLPQELHDEDTLSREEYNSLKQKYDDYQQLKEKELEETRQIEKELVVVPPDRQNRRQLLLTGHTLLGIGIVSLAASALFYYDLNKGPETATNQVNKASATLVFLTIGSLNTAGSIPCYLTAAIKYRRKSMPSVSLVLRI
jgi:hypothetical protein